MSMDAMDEDEDREASWDTIDWNYADFIAEKRLQRIEDALRRRARSGRYPVHEEQIDMGRYDPRDWLVVPDAPLLVGTTVRTLETGFLGYILPSRQPGWMGVCVPFLDRVADYERTHLRRFYRVVACASCRSYIAFGKLEMRGERGLYCSTLCVMRGPR